VRAVCFALGVSRSDVWAMRDRPSKWTDFRKLRPGHDHSTFKASDVRWCSDGLELSFDNGKKVRVAFALDRCDGEIIRR
jgi:hypothetical protein